MSHPPLADRPAARSAAIPPGMRWAWVLSHARRVSGGAFKVLSTLAYRAMRGTCYPSHAVLMGDTGLSRSGVRKAIAALEEAGAITVSGAGGRRPDGGGLSCTYGLNLPLSGPDNVSRAGGEPAPDNSSTCPGGGGNLSLEEPQKRDERDLKKQKEAAAPGGAGVFFSQKGMQDLAESLAVREGGEATKQQLQTIAGLAKRRHPGLQYVGIEWIIQSIAAYDRAVCNWVWCDCDQYPPQGADARTAYAERFKGRKSATGGWDRYKPRRKRSEPLRSAEASAWIQGLQGEAQP